MRRFLPAAVAAAVLATPSHAAVKVFTNRTAFDEAIIDMTAGTFSTSKGAVKNVYSYGPVSFDYAKVGDHAILSDGNFGNATYLAGGTGTAAISTTTTALGFYIGSLDLKKTLGYSFNGSTGTFSLSSQPDKTTAFLGFVDTSAISGTFSFGMSEYDVTSFVTGSIRPADPAPGSPAPSAAAVPEPGTWLMMILGFGLIGTMMRRRQSVASVKRWHTA